jgi:hypothetical protein
VLRGVRTVKAINARVFRIEFKERNLCNCFLLLCSGDVGYITFMGTDEAGRDSTEVMKDESNVCCSTDTVHINLSANAPDVSLAACDSHYRNYFL